MKQIAITFLFSRDYKRLVSSSAIPKEVFFVWSLRLSLFLLSFDYHVASSYPENILFAYFCFCCSAGINGVGVQVYQSGFHQNDTVNMPLILLSLPKWYHWYHCHVNPFLLRSTTTTGVTNIFSWYGQTTTVISRSHWSTALIHAINTLY